MEGETKKCPGCGIENSVSRVTCKACHTKIGERKKKEKKIEGEQGSPNPFVELPPEILPQEKSEDTPPRGKNNTIQKDWNEPKKIVRRRRKKNAVSSLKPIFFIIDSGKLQAVTVDLVISKPIKPKDLPDNERGIIKFFNRNVSLFSG